MLQLSDFLALAGTESRYRRGPRPAGFLAGLWHGIALVVAFVIAAFDPTVQLYEIRNNGRFYDLGFLLGVMLVFGGGGATGPRIVR
jgi:hypothetical protein